MAASSHLHLGEHRRGQALWGGTGEGAPHWSCNAGSWPRPGESAGVALPGLAVTVVAGQLVRGVEGGGGRALSQLGSRWVAGGARELEVP